MKFSIVIPTYNRIDKLKECIASLCAQDFSKDDFEIIVVDDGSQDGTRTVLEKINKKSPVLLRAFSQPNQGQGIARNLGIKEAKGDIILLLGDDIVTTPELLKEHELVHRRHPEEQAAVLGFITWHPKLKLTPLMSFMERGGALLGRFGGHQFAYDLLKGKKAADYRFFYTSNVSVKRSLLLKFKFDPWFSGYGWEDIELGYRLAKKASLVLYYQPAAVVYHDHAIDDLDFAKRMRHIGESGTLLHNKYPELGIVPSRRKQFIFRLLARFFATRFMKHLWCNLYFYALSKKYFLEGLKKSYNTQQV